MLGTASELKTFNIDLPDNECSRVVTVGDLYRLVLSKLELPDTQANEVEAGTHGRDRSHLMMPSLSSWSPPDVWRTLKGIIVDQLQVEEEDVKEEAIGISASSSGDTAAATQRWIQRGQSEGARLRALRECPVKTNRDAGI